MQGGGTSLATQSHGILGDSLVKTEFVLQYVTGDYLRSEVNGCNCYLVPPNHDDTRVVPSRSRPIPQTTLLRPQPPPPRGGYVDGYVGGEGVAWRWPAEDRRNL